MSLKNNKVVYVYRDAAARPFYVGMGTMMRAYEMSNRNPDFHKCIAEYEHAKGVPCYPEIVSTYLTEELACELESFLIEEIGILELTNILRGTKLAKCKKRAIIDPEEIKDIEGLTIYKRTGKIQVHCKKQHLGYVSTIEEGLLLLSKFHANSI